MDQIKFKTGDTIKVFEKVPGAKAKSQPFEGIAIARKHGNEPGATFTVRATVEGFNVEKIYPLHSPLIEKIELIKKGGARRSKLYYIRDLSKKKLQKKLK